VSCLQVFLVDDHDVVRDGLHLYIDEAPDMEVVGEAGTAAAAVEQIEDLAPDVAIIDTALPDGEGVGVIRSLRDRGVRTRCIIFTCSQSEDMLIQARMAGAASYLFKSEPREQLLAAVRAVAAGHTGISPTLLDRVRSDHDTPSLDELLPDFTAQERRILALIAEGATNREIGERLGVTEKTARNHVSAILSKLGLRNRTEVAVYVTRRLATPPRRVRVRSCRTAPNSMVSVVRLPG
jgi:two-component system response regulator DevR